MKNDRRMSATFGEMEKTPVYKPMHKNREKCPREFNAAIYATGELSGNDLNDYEAHLAECTICRHAVESSRHIIACLQSAPRAEVSHDLAPEILTRIDQMNKERALTPRWRRAPWLAAAAIALLLGGTVGLWLYGKGKPNTPMFSRTEKPILKNPSVARIVENVSPATASVPTADAEQAIDWLCRMQEPDGSWSATRWGGDQRFQVALTGLSLLAMLGPDSLTPERSMAVHRAVQYLMNQQNEQGVFGPTFDMAPYNHGIATLAILRAYKHQQQGDVKHSLNLAIDIICGRQTQDGGWGYLQQNTPSPNLSVTLWQLEALKLAGTLGWESVRPNIQHGIRWVAGMVDDRGSFGYRQTRDFPNGSQTLTAMGAMSVLDSSNNARLISPALRNTIKAKVREAALAAGPGIDFYRAYFLTAALKQMNDEGSVHYLAAVRRDLQRQQTRGGSNSGSWAPDSQWGSVGGRLYATTLASLSLR